MSETFDSSCGVPLRSLPDNSTTTTENLKAQFGLIKLSSVNRNLQQNFKSTQATDFPSHENIVRSCRLIVLSLLLLLSKHRSPFQDHVIQFVQARDEAVSYDGTGWL